MNKQEKIQKAVDAAIASVPSHWRETKTTKKALAQLEELGLSQYVPAWMTRHWPRCRCCGETDNLTEVIATPMPTGTYHLCPRCLADEEQQS